MHRYITVPICLLILFGTAAANAASFYTQRLEDPKAVYVTPSGGDDTVALQQALNKVQETTGEGIVFLGPGRYRISDTLYIWPSIRVIGYGDDRPVIVLPAHTAGFIDASHEKVMIFFAGRRPRSRRSGTNAVPDANPGTFYSALANVDFQIGEGDVGAVGVRARYAQHCYLAHMDFHLGPALAAIHEGGNVVEDVHFFGGTHAVWTSKPSPGWQFTLIDCSFEGQREAAILEHEAGLTLIRPHFLHEKTAVEIEPEWVDELWVQDAQLEEISGPAFIFGMEKNPRNQINMEHVDCHDVPVFAALRESGRFFSAPAPIYTVTNFSHGLRYADIGADPVVETHFDAGEQTEMPDPVTSDLPAPPDCSMWVNAHDMGAVGDGKTDDTDALQQAIANNRAVYLPSGFYIVHDTLTLRPDTVLIGLHPGKTQIILPDGTPGYEGSGEPKALLEAPVGGSNIVIGIGLYTSGNNPRAVGALWKAGTSSLMNDVRFLGGHGTPKPDGSRESPYNGTHTADPDPNRHWDSEYPSLWVTDGGGGTFLDIWTPSTFAHAGMMVSDTQTEGRAYQVSIEHHVHHELQVKNAANWSFYALQTEEERGESGLALPIEVVSSHDITFVNFHSYRVIASFQPCASAVKVSGSRNIRFLNFHCDSNSKAAFDSGVTGEKPDFDIRKHEFAWLDISGKAAGSKTTAPASVLAHGAKVQKLVGGFFNISGGAAGPHGDFYFVDAHPQRIYRWDSAAKQLSTISDEHMDPVNLAADVSGNLMVVSYEDDTGVYALDGTGRVLPLRPQTVTDWPGKRLFVPVSDWRFNRSSLEHPAAWYISPDGTTVLPVGEDFLDGATSWGVKSSPEVRTFGLGRAEPGKPFYVTSESELRTWAADVTPDGRLKNFHLFAEDGGEGVTSDSQGNVYIAAGQIDVYDPDGKSIGTIDVPERPLQLVFGGENDKTLFIPARTALYSVRIK